MVMLKIPVADMCPACQGAAYLPAGEAISNAGEVYTRYAPCLTCEGSGRKTRWIGLKEFAKLLKQSACQHEHISATGGWHYSDGDVFDDIRISCTDCGADMD